MATTLVYQPTRTTIDALVLDAAPKVEHTHKVEVTKHPVERGANVTDHARPEPDELTIEGLVSNTPLSGSGATGRGVAGLAESAYSTLRALKDSPRLVTILTDLGQYDDMVLTELKVPRDGKSGDAVRFTATFLHVRLVSNATTVVATKTPKAKPKAQAGQVTTTPYTPPNYGAPLVNKAINAAFTGGQTSGGAP